jgi:hypothetical protein
MSAALTQAHELRVQLDAKRAELDALAHARDALVTTLLGDYTTREVAYLLGISHARVAQLGKRSRDRDWPATGATGRPAPAGRDLASEREAHYLRCEQACRGAMLTPAGQAKGVDPRDVLTRASLLRYASEELLTHLASDPCPRGHDRHAASARRAVYDRSIA